MGSEVAARLPGVRVADAHMVGLFYAGNLRGLGSALDTVPVNTDDRPVFEYSAPKTVGDAGSRATGLRLVRLYDALLAGLPPDRDAGLAFYKYHVFRTSGRDDLAQAFLDRFRERVPTYQAPVSEVEHPEEPHFSAA